MKKTPPSPEIKCEANLLDLNDVEYVDVSDDEERHGNFKLTASEADTMTPAEAENLLSSK